MKKVLMTAVIALACYGAQAQTTAHASASVDITITVDGIITIAADHTTAGVHFTSGSDITGGLDLGSVVYTVQSNEHFSVTNSLATLTWADNGWTENTSEGDANSMDVNAVSFQCTAAAPGGTNAASAATSFDATNQSVLTNCDNGGDQEFTMDYKVNPGWSSAEGIYTGTIVTTATQD